MTTDNTGIHGDFAAFFLAGKEKDLMKRIILFMSPLVFFTSFVQAITIHIDFSDDQTNPTGNWNIITTPNTTNNNLIDFNSGLATSVSITTSSFLGETGTINTWTGGNVDWVEAVAARDYFGVHVLNTAFITIGGLNDVSLYDIEIVSSSNGFGSSHVADITLNGNFADTNFNGTPSVDGNDFDTRIDGRDPANWLIWNNESSIAGNISISISTLSNQGEINALRISPSPVPEPSTYALLSLLGLGFLLYRRGTKA